MKYLKLYEAVNDTMTFMDAVVRQHGEGRDPKSFIDISIYDIALSNMKVPSLEGIEQFTNLKAMWFNDNGLESLKGIENMIQFKFISCINNELNSLKELKNLVNLDYIGAYGNRLKSIDEEILNLPKLHSLDVERADFGSEKGNPWEFPLPSKITSKFCIIYTPENRNRFSSYEYQKWFLEERPEKVKDLEPFGFDKKIKKEYGDLLEFFNIKL